MIENFGCRNSGTGKSPEPADKNVCAMWRRLSSLRVEGTFQSLVGNSSKMSPIDKGMNQVEDAFGVPTGTMEEKTPFKLEIAWQAN
jgi:hypothetical protein